MIICFSGTGNTFYVASKLAEKTGNSIFMLEGIHLQNPESSKLDTAPGDETVIWAFPTYSWGVPPVMVRFIETFTAGKGFKSARHYMLTTCGDDMGQTDRQWRRLMERRGFNAISAFSVIMPNTYVCMKGFDVDTPEMVRSKIEAADSKIVEIADIIRSEVRDLLNPGAFAWLKSRIVYPWFARYAMSAKPFRHTEACVGCGKCAKLCPMENITMTQNKQCHPAPMWGLQCTMCLRCYHSCPQHAVAYGRKTDGKGQQWLGFKDLK